MSAPSIAGVSRFQAIVTAKPLHGTGPPVISDQVYRASAYEPWNVRFQTGKRRRETNEAGPSTVKKAARRTSEDEGASGKEPTTLFRDRNELLSALRTRFKQGPDVDFHGMYEMVDAGVTHKQRIQTIAHEIWKTTGYRFTVKDHPQFTNGHKTRFWCSQDEAHRSKSSRAARKAQGTLYRPRMTSAGETMAKARYPCKSRLLISSRDSHLPGTRIITVRMHHHATHEPYVDSNLPPEVAQGIWESCGWTSQQEPVSSSSSGVDAVMEPPVANMIQEEEEEFSEEENSPPGSYEQMDDEIHEVQPPPQMNNHHAPPNPHPQQQHAQSHPQPQPQLQPEPEPEPQPTSEIYHHRMQAHISNLREFCEGLEYQLQFNDYRMLDVLEREGGSFLTLVADCLRKEGRLVNTEQPAVLQSDTGQMMNGHSHSHTPGDVDLVNGAMDISRGYEGNPGINPRALGC